jgi:hypothetical protein
MQTALLGKADVLAFYTVGVADYHGNMQRLTAKQRGAKPYTRDACYLA